MSALLRQVILGVLAALFSTGIVIGSLTISLVEGGARLAQAPARGTAQESSLASPLTAPTSSLPEESPISTSSPPPVILDLPTATPVCTHPSGWMQVTTQVGDTLAGLAQEYGSNEQDLMKYNCLVGRTLAPASLLYVPALPAASPTAVPPTEAPPTAQPSPQESQPKCGPPHGWVLYTIQPGDTLYWISLVTGTSVNSLQSANCLGGSTTIRTGQQLWVPVLPPPRLPYFSPTPRPSATQPPATAVPTNTPETPSPTIQTEVPTNPPATTEPPVITTEPATTQPPTEPPVTTTEPPVITTVPAVITDPPPATTEPPPVVTSPPTILTEPPSPSP